MCLSIGINNKEVDNASEATLGYKSPDCHLTDSVMQAYKFTCMDLSVQQFVLIMIYASCLSSMQEQCGGKLQRVSYCNGNHPRLFQKQNSRISRHMVFCCRFKVFIVNLDTSRQVGLI